MRAKQFVLTTARSKVEIYLDPSGMGTGVLWFLSSLVM